MLELDLPLGYDATAVGDVARRAEADGLGGVWSLETGHDPYLPLALVADVSRRIRLGTAIAVAFARSPTAHAQVAWDLQRLSKGRFVLGLGSQVRAHNERRYGVPGDRPAARMRDLIRAIRAVWRSWQTDERLDHRGEFYQLTLMTPFFNPGPLEWGPPPILLAAVRETMLTVAGSECEGVHVHPLHTAEWLDTVILPVARGAAEAVGRNPDALEFVVPVMIATGPTPAAARSAVAPLRAQIGFYGSTPTYSEVLERQGYGETARRLHALSRRGDWDAMTQLVDDDLVEAICTVAPWNDLAASLATRYRGRATRLMPYSVPGDGAPWAEIARELRSG